MRRKQFNMKHSCTRPLWRSLFTCEGLPYRKLLKYTSHIWNSPAQIDLNVRANRCVYISDSANWQNSLENRHQVELTLSKLFVLVRNQVFWCFEGHLSACPPAWPSSCYCGLIPGLDVIFIRCFDDTSTHKSTTWHFDPSAVHPWTATGLRQ